MEPKKTNWVAFTLLNFASPIVFFWAFQVWGAKPAIGTAILSTLIQVLVHLWAGIKFSPFFIVASGFTVLFGGMDIFVTHPRFFRLEPAAQNFIMGSVFLVTFLTRHPIALWFAESLPEEVRPQVDPLMKEYLRKVTLIWAVYLYLKAALFLWLAFRVDLGALVLLRSVIGGGTLALLVGGEIVYRKKFMKR